MARSITRPIPAAPAEGTRVRSIRCRRLLRRHRRLLRAERSFSLAAGLHPSQTLVEDVGVNGCTDPVVFQPVPDASVTVGSVIFGTNSGGFSSNAPDNITLRGFSFPTGIIKMWGNAKNVLVDNVDGGSVLIQGATNVTVKNSDFGPCPSSGPGSCSRVFVLDATNAGEPPTTNILFEGNTIHDFTIAASGDHWECVFASGGTNVAFRGNKFWNCETNAMAIGPGGCACGVYVNWDIENNWFGRTCCFGTTDRNTAVNITSNIDVLVRFNSFAGGQTYVNEGGGSTPNVHVVANTLGGPGCAAGTVYQFNLVRGGTCGANSTNISSMPYVNGSNQAAMDYHLAGVSVADGYVTATNADASLGTDFDGEVRSAPRDAGSDEH
jgi:hypothetical protein